MVLNVYTESSIIGSLCISSLYQLRCGTGVSPPTGGDETSLGRESGTNYHCQTPCRPLAGSC